MIINKTYTHKLQQITGKERNRSYFVIIPNDIVSYLKLKKGDRLVIDVNNKKEIIIKIEKL